MTTITEKQATHQITKQTHGTERESGKIGADGKLFSFDDDNSSTVARETTTTTTTTKTTNDSTTTTVQYDVEHLATFSTASSHEQQVGAAAAAATTTAPPPPTNHNNRSDESSKVKLKQATTNDSSSITEPREALQKLFELEKLSGIWTQRMQIELQLEFMLIVDCETNSVVERFHRNRVTKPEAFNHYNDIYNNIVVFNIDQPFDGTKETQGNEANEDCDKTSGELHIFQCVSHKAKQLVSDILAWKSGCQVGADSTVGRPGDSEDDTMPSSGPTTKGSDDGKEASKSSSKGRSQEKSGESLRKPSMEDDPTPATTSDSNNLKPVVTVASSSKSSEPEPIVNVNVKETVQVFNQIAALREKSSGVGQTARPLSDASSSSQTGSAGSQQQQQQSQFPVSSEFSRAPLGPSGHSYKQRSIRATLAPKPDSNKEQAKNHNQDQSTSSSSSTTSSTEQNNNNGGVSAAAAKFAASSSAASQSDHHHNHNHHHHNSTRDQSSGQASSSSSVTVPATTTATATGRPDGKSQQPSGLKHTTGHNNNSHTQSSSSGHHNHNHQQQPHVKGKSVGNKPGSASSRLPATNGHHHSGHYGNQGASLGIQSSNSSGRSHGSPPLQQQQPVEQVTSNESYVSVLNHCFDDIEKFILRIQHAYTAMRELQAKKRHTKRAAAAAAAALATSQTNKSHPNGPLPPLPHPLSASELAMLSAQARGPNADDFFEILSKFKLAFNLLAKLKGCIHEPNAPELVHFLFTPLAIIIESARNVTPPVDPTVVGIPYLNRDALDLLSNCCTSKESDLWLSLGPNWTETIDAKLLKASRLPSSFQPIFSDGWAPVISELELIGLVVPTISQSQLLPAMSLPEADSHYCSSGVRSSGGPNQLMMEESALVSRSSNHVEQTIRNGPQPPPLPHHPSSTNNGVMSSSSSSSSAKANGALSSRYADPMMQTGYMRQPEMMIEGPLAIVDPDHAAELQMAHHRHPQSKSNSSRHSMPTSEKSSRSGTKHPAHGASARRNSDYIGHGQYAPPSIPNGSFIGPQDDHHHPHHQHLNGRFSSYPPTNPSDDYTELSTNHYAAGPSARHIDGHLSYAAGPTTQPTSNDQSRRRASKSSYNRRYLSEPHYEEHGHDDLMMHEVEREAMLVDMGPAQTEWFYELKLRGALIVRVLFTREANNDKELTVKRGEILEILDDTRKWWKARNIDLQVAYVPHTIVAVMEHYQTLDELLTGSSGDMMMMINEDQAAVVNSQRYAHHREPLVGEGDYQNQYHDFREGRRNSKTAKGAFRYF